MKKILFISFIMLIAMGMVHSQSITVTSPNGGENWKIGDVRNITWTSSDVSGNVTLKLYRGGTDLGRIEANPLPISPGIYTWTILSSLPNGTPIIPGSNYQVMVRHTGEINGLSKAAFTISPSGPLELAPGKPGNLVVTSPKSAEERERGKSYPIRWLRFRILKSGKKVQVSRQIAKKTLLKLSTVIIQIKKVQCPNEIWLAGDHPPWKTITSSTQDIGVYNWFIPADYNLGCYIIRLIENQIKGQKAVSKSFTITKNKNEPRDILTLEEKK